MSCHRYRVTGLVSRPELNGMILPAVTPPSPEHAQELLEKGRILVAVFPAPIAVKKENLALIDENDPSDATIDWSFADTPPILTVLDIVMRTDTGLVDNCTTFVKHVMCHLTQQSTPPRLPVAKLTRTVPEIHSAIMNTPGHCIYFFFLNQIAQSLVLETHCGKARIFSSVVKDWMSVPVQLGIPGIKIGYSPREWATSTPQDRWHWSDEMKAAHARWGGGRELSRNDLEAFLALLFDLQDYAEALARVIIANLPDRSLKMAEEVWDQTFAAALAQGRADQQHSQMEIPSSPLTKISHAYSNDRAAPCLTRMEEFPPCGGDSLHIFSNERAAANGLPPFEIRLDNSNELLQFNKAFISLVGSSPVPNYVYLALLNHRKWKDLSTDFYGSGSAWAFSVVTIPH